MAASPQLIIPANRRTGQKQLRAALERVRLSFELRVYGYVVMPEHVHLLLSEPQQHTLDAIKSLKQGNRGQTGLTPISSQQN